MFFYSCLSVTKVSRYPMVHSVRVAICEAGSCNMMKSYRSGSATFKQQGAELTELSLRWVTTDLPRWWMPPVCSCCCIPQPGTPCHWFPCSWLLPNNLTAIPAPQAVCNPLTVWIWPVNHRLLTPILDCGPFGAGMLLYFLFLQCLVQCSYLCLWFLGATILEIINTSVSFCLMPVKYHIVHQTFS